MSTFPLAASDVAPIVRYLADPAVADVLARALVGNRAACLRDGWPAAHVPAAPTAVDIIIAAAPLKRPARLDAVRAVTSIGYNANACGVDFLTAADNAALDDLLVRVMAGARVAEVDEDDAFTMAHYIKRAKTIVAARPLQCTL